MLDALSAYIFAVNHVMLYTTNSMLSSNRRRIIDRYDILC